jgi:small subunit ribosomal protein S8
MNNDPLANAMSKIVNYERIGRDSVQLYPVGLLAKRVLEILNKHGYVGVFEERDTTRGSVLKVPLLGTINNAGVIKPRFAVQTDAFEKYEKRFLPAQGVGVIIISTSKGLMTLDEAKKENVGGRLIAYCY